MDIRTFDLADLLERLVDGRGSDIHLKVGNRPLVRIDGNLGPIDPDAAPLQPRDTEEILHALLPESRVAEFETEHEIDFAYSVRGLARFRVNAYKQRGSVSLVLRVVRTSFGTIDQLGLPELVSRLAEEERGIVLVTGTTGCGKSTTLAAMIDHINATMCKHIITVEDPIEYLHADKLGAIDQREVGGDTDSFHGALRRILRQDPDVILIGEMRDEETVRAALSAAETGHLVLSTLHTVDAAETITRIVDFFAAGERQQVRAMLAGTLKGIVSQRLVPRMDGVGRTVICETLTMTGRARDMILDPEQTGRLVDVISEGSYYGMQTFDQALYHAVTAGTVAMDVAQKFATRPHDFKLLVDARGRRATSMEDIPVTPRNAEPRAPRVPKPRTEPSIAPPGAPVASS